jgi:hypothetical protein
MFNRLRQKWNVSWLGFALIFCTFAIGGSCCGFLGRKLVAQLNIDNNWFRILIYIVIVTLLWPFCVLIISIPLGQFSFFKTFLSRMFNRLRGKSSSI